MNCLFCKIVNGEEEAFKLYEDDKIIVILDKFPSLNGHTLVIPKKHYTDYKEIDDEMLLHINKIVPKISDMLMEKLNAQSITLSVNYGKRQIIKHYHLHLLPDLDVHKKKEKVEEVYERLTKK